MLPGLAGREFWKSALTRAIPRVRATVLNYADLLAHEPCWIHPSGLSRAGLSLFPEDLQRVTSGGAPSTPLSAVDAEKLRQDPGCYRDVRKRDHNRQTMQPFEACF